MLKTDAVLDDALKSRINVAIRTKASARHVPNEIYAVSEIPRTLTGKKMEVPVRKLLLGMPRDKVASADSMVNPASMDFFVTLALQLALAQKLDAESAA